MGRRSRKPRPAAARERAGGGGQQAPGGAARERASGGGGQRATRSAARERASGAGGRRMSRSEARNAAVRAQLRPYAPDERPPALRVAVAVAALLGLGNLVAFAAGMEVGGQKPDPFGVVLISVLMLVAAAGMWHKRYWAVLGFEALLAITVIWASLSLLVAGNLAAVAVCVAIIGLGGWLFWKLVRVMSRIQVPRPGDGRRPGIG